VKPSAGDLAAEREPPLLLAIVGQTASGKGGVARRIASGLGAEIISLDSMKVYRHLDIGTGKPIGETRSGIPHHLIDVVSPDEHFDVKLYVEKALQARDEIEGRGKTPLFVGGTALYLKGLLEGLFEGPTADAELRCRLRARATTEGSEALHRELGDRDPRAASKIHPNDLRRIVRALEVVEKTGRPISELQVQFGAQERRFRPRLAGILWPRERLRERIERRVDRMFQDGLVDEVRSLRSRGLLGRISGQALGYPEVLRAEDGELSLDEARERIKRNTWRFSRQQMTWFKKIPEIRWFPVESEGDLEAIEPGVRDHLARG
jgi:tRNA dimethylallyltransferase